MLMGMRSGFRRMTGAAHATKSAQTTSRMRRAIVIAVGAVIVFALIWGLAQR